jgi:hypothetical protein
VRNNFTIFDFPSTSIRLALTLECRILNAARCKPATGPELPANKTAEGQRISSADAHLGVTGGMARGEQQAGSPAARETSDERRGQEKDRSARH